jgi:hypothetical protein
MVGEAAGEASAGAGDAADPPHVIEAVARARSRVRARARALGRPARYAHQHRMEQVSVPEPEPEPEAEPNLAEPDEADPADEAGPRGHQCSLSTCSRWRLCAS